MTPLAGAVAVFLLCAVGTAAFGLRVNHWAVRARKRLAPHSPVPGTPLGGRRRNWMGLLAWIGDWLPASGKDLPQLKRRLVRAGFRQPAAPRYFKALRVFSLAAAASTGFAVALEMGVAADRVILATAAAAIVGYLAPGEYLNIRISRRKHAIEVGLPNALDLMVVCVESGLGIDQTILQVAKELQLAHPEISDEFNVMNLELRAGKRRHEALHNLADRAGVADLKKLVAVLVQTDRFGTSIAQSLRGHADYLRILARQRAEERAAKLAVKLVFPIFFCVLPSLFVVTVGPVITRLVRDLLPALENM